MTRRKVRYCLLIIVLLFTLTSADEANARRRARQNHNYDFTTSQRYAALVVNAKTGDVVYQKEADKQLHPASLTKMMTLYLAFDAISSGELALNQLLPVSHKASMMPKTRLGLKPGQTIMVRDAILGLIIHSANDASVVLAEALAGTEVNFASRMTEVAHQLGMADTTFKNASGLPDSEQVTTAYDMAKLAIALRRDHPRFYSLFSRKSFKFRGSIISSHNRVLDRYEWADGIKTGYTQSSGFNLVTSTSRPDGKLVGVVLGGPSASARDNHMIQLLDYGYNKIGKTQVAKVDSSKLGINKRFPSATVVQSPSAFDAIDVNSQKYVASDHIPDDPFAFAELDDGLISTDVPRTIKETAQKLISKPAEQTSKLIKVAKKVTKKAAASKVAKSKLAQHKRKFRQKAV